MLRYLALIIIFLCPTVLIHSQTPELDYFSMVDWSEGKMFINVQTVFAPGSGAPRMRDLSEDAVRRNFFTIFMDSIRRDKNGELFFNSSSTIEEQIQLNPNILSHINDIYNNITRTFSTHNRNMTGMNMQYKLDIHRDIGSYFITHRTPLRSERTILWTPSARFTGVVIYADAEFPVHGENRTSFLSPAMFPSVFDERMRRVVTKEMVQPAFLKKWGTAGYFSDPNDPRIRERVGDRPLFTSARRLFGRYNTDIIIPAEDANKLFFMGQNANLISEGRFVIIRTLPSDTP
ncbi:MAG: hypothetical protein FWC36_04070 [Spirochaetes bacterium]|nr:hypothetical protein [Spirochaetota bacterium]